MSVKEKRIARFTGSGTWTVPTGVTYAIAHMLGGGGGVGSSGAGHGGNSSVAFSSGTVSATGGRLFGHGINVRLGSPGFANGAANSGRGPSLAYNNGQSQRDGGTYANATDANWIVAGGTVTPAASVTVTVGAGGSAGTNGGAGGSGYVYIEYYEEV